MSFIELKAQLQSYGGFGPLVLIGLYVLSSVILFPATFFTVLAGALYGTFDAMVYVTIGANLGASLAFFLGRKFSFGFAQKALHKHFPEAEKEILSNGFSWVFGLRLLPVTPFVFFNYAAGLTPIRWRDYALGSLLGMLPMTFVYATLGSSLGSFAEQGTIDWSHPSNWLPFLIAIALAWITRRFVR